MHEFTPPSTLPRILLVEDHDLTRRMQVRFLSRTYSVDFASTAEEAYQMAFQRPYAVLVMDLNLSGPMSGYALMQHLRATPRHRATPMVAVTSHQQPGERESLMRAGFDLYLSKPFRWQAFADTIRAAVALGVVGDGYDAHGTGPSPPSEAGQHGSPQHGSPQHDAPRRDAPPRGPQGPQTPPHQPAYGRPEAPEPRPAPPQPGYGPPPQGPPGYAAPRPAPQRPAPHPGGAPPRDPWRRIDGM